MNSKDNNTESLFKQLDSLLSSNMPEEYKTILRHFQQQGEFFAQFIQQPKKEQLSDFWNLSKTLNVNSKTDAFTNQTILSLIKRLSTALDKITEQHTRVSQQAVGIFQSQLSQTEEPSAEQLCEFWLQAGEKAYEDISQSRQYKHANQEFFEAIKALSQAHQETIQQFYGLPNQQTVEDLQKGLHQLRNDFASYKEQTDTTINQLTARLEQLT